MINLCTKMKEEKKHEILELNTTENTRISLIKQNT